MALTVYISFHSPYLNDAPPKGLALIGQVVSEKKIVEYYGHIHVYSPGAGADNPLRTLFPST